MARGVNKVILVGNAGNDPEVKYTQGGMAVATLSLATTSVRKDKDGNQTERTEWHRVKFFGKLAEIVGEYVKKGRQLYVEGSIRYDKFTGADGIEKYITDIVGDQMQMLGPDPSRGEERPTERRQQQASSRPARPAPQRQAPPPSAAHDFADDFVDDSDIPY